MNERCGSPSSIGGPRGRELLVLTTGSGSFMASYFAATVPAVDEIVFGSASVIVLSALPSYYYLFRWGGIRRAFVLITTLSIFSIIIEAIGITTGFPYGVFSYTDRLGFKIFGLVPWSVTFAFTPLLLGAFTIASRLVDDACGMILLSAVILLAFDLILDPTAVLLNIWIWSEPGPYYGVPLSNYLGWMFTGTIMSIIMRLLLGEKMSTSQRMSSGIASSLFITLVFWTGFSLWSLMIIPLLIGVILLILVSPYVATSI